MKKMRPILSALALAALAGGAVASDLGAAGPAPRVKQPTFVEPAPVDPEVLRQGGDTIADAITIPSENHTVTGTTAGYTDDYDEVCPFDGSVAPDVVYHLDHGAGGYTVSIDMYHSDYDTKIYVYDENLELVACNDDYYDDYTSYIPSVELLAGVEYYLVIDGYGNQSGSYQCTIRSQYPPWPQCLPSSVLEGEPELVNEYVDEFNGGCNNIDAPGGPQFQHIASESFCGQAGWYMVDGSVFRDTDWFTLTMPASGELVIHGMAQRTSVMYELGPQDCGEVVVLQSAEIYQEGAATMTINGTPGSTVWFWFGAATWDPPGGELPLEYTYLLEIPQVVATERQSWTAVKGLFD
jgi:hypothetical protein